MWRVLCCVVFYVVWCLVLCEECSVLYELCVMCYVQHCDVSWCDLCAMCICATLWRELVWRPKHLHCAQTFLPGDHCGLDSNALNTAMQETFSIFRDFDRNALRWSFSRVSVLQCNSYQCCTEILFIAGIKSHKSNILKICLLLRSFPYTRWNKNTLALSIKSEHRINTL